MGQDVCLIRSRDQSQRYLNYFLHSTWMANQLALLMVGSTFDRINVSDVKALLIPVPPRLEQDRIASCLDTMSAAVYRVLYAVEEQIKTVREYRTRLIAAVVTGKLDVRDAAARLPEDAEDEPLNEMERAAEPSDEAMEPEETVDEEVDLS